MPLGINFWANLWIEFLRRRTNDERSLFVGESRVKLDADTVDQLYHLTKHRHELSLATKPAPKWTTEQFEQASELMSLISGKSTQMRQTLSLVTDLAEDLSLVDLDRVNA